MGLISKANKTVFNRRVEWAERCKELKVQRAFTHTHLRLKESLLENALMARRTAKGPSDANVKRLMMDWILIHEEIDAERREAT